MSYVKFVTSVLFASTAGLFLFSSTVLANDPELYFYPEKKWSVKRINSEEDATPICAISNQLNNGYVVELSGTSSGFNTLNIDFKQDAFEKSMKYEVQYLVPGISRALITSEASEENLITSDLSGNATFSDQIKTASVVDISIRDNTFRLYLTGLEAKMPFYNECAKGLPDMDMASASPDQDASSLSAPEAQYIPPQPKSATDGLAPPPPLRNTSGYAIEGHDTLAMDEASKARPVPSGEPRYIEVLAEKLRQQNSEASSSKTISSESNLEESTDAPSSATSTKDGVTSLKAIYNITKSEKPFVADLTRVAKEENDLQERIASSNNIANSLPRIEPASGNADNSSVNGNFVDMRNKISSLEHQIKTLNDKNLMLDEELQMTLQDTKSERMSVSSDNWNLERATMRFNESERQITRLGRQLHSLKSSCDTEKAELENMLFDPKLTNQNQLTKLSSMETELDKAKSSLRLQQRQYEERIKILEQRLGQL